MNNESGISLDTHATLVIVIKAGICTVETNYRGFQTFSQSRSEKLR